MKSKHDRKIVFSGIDLVGEKLKHAFECFKNIRNSIEPLMISNYLTNAPFLWVGMVFRYGLKNEIIPHYRRIDKVDGELELAKELDMRVLLTADEISPNLLEIFFEIATLDSLLHAGKKYKLNVDALFERRQKLGKIPEWDPEMDNYPDILVERYKDTTLQENEA